MIAPHPGPLLEIEGLSAAFRTGRSQVRALDRVGLSVGPRETVGLVGESGSGKTTLAGAVLGLVKPTAGHIRFDGRDITRARRAGRRAISRELQVVFQDPYGSLSPTRTVGQTLTEPLAAHHLASPRDARLQAAAMLAQVGLPPDAMDRYPSEFSGGQRQRIAIARALMPSPRLVICDEPVSALDLSIQAQVLNLLRQLQDQHNLSYLFIAHNLAVVRHMSHRIVVLYRGCIMETGPADAVYRTPAHPYTRALLQAAPVANPGIQAARRAATPPPAPAQGNPGHGCPFASRCPHVISRCREVQPDMVATPAGTQAACLRVTELADMRLEYTNDSTTKPVNG